MGNNKVEHFDLTGKKAIVFAANQPAGVAIADAYEEAGATVARIDQAPADQVTDKINAAANATLVSCSRYRPKRRERICGLKT